MTPRSLNVVLAVIAILVIMVIVENLLLPFPNTTETPKPIVTFMVRDPTEAEGVKIDTTTIRFNKASLKSVMRAISSNYNVPVVYVGSMPNGSYTAVIDINTPLADLISTLNSVGIAANYDGNQITVTGK